MNIRFRQKWGNISTAINATQYLNDGSKKDFRSEVIWTLEYLKGLVLNINLIREQYNLAAGSTSIEELLLQQRQIATDYETRFSIGLSYTFGYLQQYN